METALRAVGVPWSLVHLVLRLGAVAADPREGPVGGQFGALRDVLAPGVGDDRLLGLPHDIELTARLDLADHHRLGEAAVPVPGGAAAPPRRALLAGGVLA